MKHRYFSFLFIFFLFSNIFSQGFYIDSVSQAEALYNQGNYEQALNILNQVVTENPDDMYALLSKSCVLDALHQYDKALQDIQIVLQKEPFNIKAYHIRGAIYLSLGKYEKAINDENFVLEKVPDYESSLNIRGMSYGQLHQYDKAIADFNKAINKSLIKNSPSSEYYVNRAYIYYYLGDFENALNDANEAVRFGVNDPETYAIKAIVLRAIGNNEESVKVISFGIKKSPKYYELYYLRILDYLELGEYKTAKKDLDFLQDKRNEQSGYHSLLAVYSYLTGNLEKYKNELEISEKLEQNNENNFIIKIIKNESCNIINKNL